MGRFDIFPIFIATFASRRVTLIATHSKSQKQTRLPIRYLYFILPFKPLINKEVIKVFQNYINFFNSGRSTPKFCDTGNKKELQATLATRRSSLLRRERDSNPRYSCPYTAFRVRPDRPLRHLSLIPKPLFWDCKYRHIFYFRLFSCGKNCDPLKKSSGGPAEARFSGYNSYL